MKPTPQKIIIGDSTNFASSGLKKYLSDHTATFLAFFAEELSEIGQLLRTHGPLPVVLTDTFIDDVKPTCIRRLKAAVPGIKVIVLAERFMPLLRQLHSMGADTVVSKKAAFAELKSLIFKTLNTNEPLTCSILKQEFATKSEVGEDEEHTLNEKDKELVLMTIEKASRQEIAEKLCIEPNTVSKYRRRIIDKITKWGYKNLADYAQKKGLWDGRY